MYVRVVQDAPRALSQEGTPSPEALPGERSPEGEWGSDCPCLQDGPAWAVADRKGEEVTLCRCHQEEEDSWLWSQA